MNASTTPIAPLPKPWRRLGATLRSGAQWLARHQRGLGIAGLLLAQLLVLLLYFVLVDQQARLQQARDSTEQLAQERRRCNLQLDRRTRESCGRALSRLQP